jgi:uncharacterized protein (UPF0248 family)
MFYWYNKEVKRKKMKKIAIGFGIIACLAVLSLLLTSASAQEEEEEWLGCPSGDGGDRYTPPATSIYYMKYVIGIGYEDCRAAVATHSGYVGLGSSTSSRGSARIYQDSQTFNVKTAPEDPLLKIHSQVNKSYRNVTFKDGLVKPLNRALNGKTSVTSYMVGAVVSEKYMNTYDISGDFEHTGTGTSSSTAISDRKIYGTSRFAVTVNDVEYPYHTIMRVREEHTGRFEMDRDVEVDRYDAVP